MQRLMMSFSKVHAELKVANLQDQLLASIQKQMGGLEASKLIAELDEKIANYSNQPQLIGFKREERIVTLDTSSTELVSRSDKDRQES